MRGFFFGSLFWETGRERGGSWRYNHKNVEWVPETEFHTFMLSLRSASSNFLNYHLSVHISLWLQRLLVQVNCSCLIFCIHLSLQNLGGTFPCNLNFLIGPRKVIDFPVCSGFFSFCKNRVTTSKLFTHLSWNWESWYLLIWDLFVFHSELLVSVNWGYDRQR